MRFRVRGKFASEGRWRTSLETARAQVGKWGRVIARASSLRDTARKAKTRTKHERTIRAARKRYNAALIKRNALERQGQKVEKGREVEVTHTTKGGTPRHKRRGARVTKDVRKLQLKLRVKPGPNMTLAEIDGVLEDLASGARRKVPKGMTIRFADWRKGTGVNAGRGRIVTPDVLAALRAFYPAIIHETTKHGTKTLTPRRKP